MDQCAQSDYKQGKDRLPCQIDPMGELFRVILCTSLADELALPAAACVTLSNPRHERNWWRPLLYISSWPPFIFSVLHHILKCPRKP